MAFKKTAKFTAANSSLTIVVAEGKSGFNVKASLKEGSGKGAPKAKPGCRAKFDKQEEAVKAFDKLSAEAVKQGWAKVDKAERNAFTSIPSAPTTKPTNKK